MHDSRGVPVSTRSSAAQAASERALWRMMSFYGSPLEDLAAAQQADPRWVLPTLMHAGFLLSLTEPGLLGEARTLLDRAQSLAAHANARECDHLAALQTLLIGDWSGACREWEQILLQFPRDALALQWAHLFDFYRGDGTNLRQRIARVLREWDADDALHPYVLGLYAFGLEECQLYAQAEEVGRQALGGRAKVPWAIHAVAHVMEMQGRHLEGEAWMVQWQGDWIEGNGFSGHLGWHQALFALERLDHAAALRIFDAHLHPDPAQITLQRVDAASLLWRLRLLGAEVGSRWSALKAGWDLSGQGVGLYPFNDLHGMLALIGCGEIAQAQHWANCVASRADSGSGAVSAVAREIGVPLTRGVLAFARGDFDEAIAELYPVRALAIRFGGSHAQRDVLDQTLLAAAARATDKAVGRAILNERSLSKPPTPLTRHWAGQLHLRAKPWRFKAGS